MPLPQQLDFVDGSIIACAGGTAYAMVKKIDPAEGARLLVFGAGPLGLCVSLIAGARGADVLLVDVNPQRLAFARTLEASSTIDASSEKVRDAVMDLTEGQGATKIIDTSGSTRARNDAIH